MKVTHEQFNTALVAAMDSVLFEESGDADRFRTAALWLVSHLGIEVAAWAPDGCTCSPDVQENCHAPGCLGGKQVSYWVLRTWADVRRGDVVRPPGNEAAAGEVIELLSLPWRVNDIPPAQLPYESDHDYAKRVEAFNRDVQYRPNEHAGEWTARPVTLRPLAAEDPSARHRIPNVNPSAPVEIRCTQVELDVIELLGGWSQRLDSPATAPKPSGGEA